MCVCLCVDDGCGGGGYFCGARLIVVVVGVIVPWVVERGTAQ